MWRPNAISGQEITVSVHVDAGGSFDTVGDARFQRQIASYLLSEFGSLDNVRGGTPKQFPYPDFKVEVLAIGLRDSVRAVTIGWFQQCPGSFERYVMLDDKLPDDASRKAFFEMLAQIGLMRGMCYVETRRSVHVWNAQTDVQGVIVSEAKEMCLKRIDPLWKAKVRARIPNPFSIPDHAPLKVASLCGPEQ